MRHNTFSKLILRYVRPAAAAFAAALLASPARAQDPASAPAASQPAARLRVLGDNVNIRSRADLNSMIVCQVGRDAVLTAVGRENGWYRIVPPPNAFSYVSGEYIRRVSPELGVVAITDGTLRVRVGSTLTDSDPMTHEMQTRLNNGAEVRIVGEFGTWLRIVPPPDVFCYISEDLVAVEGDTAFEAPRPGDPPVIITQPTAEFTIPQVEPQPSGSTPTPTDVAVSDSAVAPRPVEPATVGDGPWARRVRVIEEWIAAERTKPPARQDWQSIVAQLQAVQNQFEEPRAAERATALVREIESRPVGAPPTSIEPTPSLPASPATVERPAAGVSSSADGTAMPTASPQSPSAAPVDLPRGAPPAASDVSQSQPASTDAGSGKFDAQGVLHPTFAIPVGANGLRYRLIDPVTKRVRAYVEFPFELSVSPSASVGRYVGIRGTLVVEADFAAPLYRATSLTTMQPPRQPPRETP